MALTVDVSGLERLTQKLEQLTDIDATPLMRTWMDIMEKDNREGILAGLDKDGVPMVPVIYRPKFGPTRNKGEQKALESARKAAIRAGRRGQLAQARRGIPAGTGAAMGSLLANNNLSSYQYRLLTGPPLAPRDQFSRVITNFMSDFDKMPSGVWLATFWWEDVVSTKGIPFLRYHFNGEGRLPMRDLRGIRPGGRIQLVESATNWARLYVREHMET